MANGETPWTERKITGDSGAGIRVFCAFFKYKAEF
jgi:hypothetical protein